MASQISFMVKLGSSNLLPRVSRRTDFSVSPIEDNDVDDEDLSEGASEPMADGASDDTTELDDVYD